MVIRRWVWLECIGVVSACCKQVYRFPPNFTYPYNYTPLVLVLLQQNPSQAISLFIFKCFFFHYNYSIVVCAL